MSSQNERGYWADPKTGEITPVPEASYGWVIEPPGEITMEADVQGDGTLKIKPMTFVGMLGTIRPATKEEAKGAKP